MAEFIAQHAEVGEELALCGVLVRQMMVAAHRLQRHLACGGRHRETRPDTALVTRRHTEGRAGTWAGARFFGVTLQ